MIETPLALPVTAAKVSLFRKLLTHPTGAASLLVLFLVALASVLAPLLATHDPNTANLKDVLAKAGSEHLLGADSAGRDVLSRLLFAGQFSLAGALLALAVALVLGVTAGLIAGYYGGWFDSVSSWLTGLMMALPGMVVLLAARAVVGPSMWLSMMIFGILLSPAFFRLVYASVTAVRNELYVDAARVSGLSDFRIIGRHILAVVRAPVIIQSAMVLGIAIAIQAGLEFLGLGDRNIPTWGSMLNDGFINIFKSPTLVLWPALIIGLVCIALTLLANAMRDELERSSGPVKKSRKAAAAAAIADAAGAAEKRGAAAVVHPDEPNDNAGELLLEVTDLGVGYDQPDGSTTHVVNHINLTVRRGEVHGLVGESGSGKTQTAFSILRLLPQGGRITGGSIFFEGKDLAHLSEKEMTKVRGKRIAYIPQEPMSNLDGAFTIGSQLMEPMRVCLGISRAEARTRALALLAKVGIPNPERTFNAYPHQISGGMAQRVLIAGAVSCEPDLLIADEPTTALDVTVQAEVLNLLRKLQDELNMGVILVTHNFGVVADLCDRVSVMQSGRVVETGPVRAIFNDARHPYTRQLLDAILEDTAPRGRYTLKELKGVTP
ncbi:dipeptide/oligopeptide/nickel ABC transporter permease/ATP-binding protein [Pseudarthrobacter sp. MDT3-28]|uniref:dipeptide/oligopeptide/nickel ABC transporter permease/ATP-binding protein n=1 Tax=Pseudarthrobacter raffinosi TaxID=2953651 RepID=UPI00208F1957|nr:dipeptide/oligopeptide/nickel ABC transporter permease/ATP-binding protein [Pseudarthrobacter sp. MDT3-28]MCO4239303.1 dipeptide/oligopeptide/nickel ABC transporter permease/ATP-binding protein [Pseudarthrobacter sp. MDT3-28]